MPKIGKMMLAAAAFAMSASPVLAAPVSNPAAKLSVANSPQVSSAVRSSSKSGDQKALGGGLLIGVIAAVVVIVGIVLIADGGSDSP